MFFWGNSFAQISVSINQQTIKQIIPQIEKTSGYNVFYTDKLPNLAEILLDLSKQTKSLEMKVINVDERDQALNIFLKKMKFRVFVKQYEMRKYFSV